MADRVDVAYVLIWDRIVGAVAWDEARGFATFEYDDDFLDLGLELSPLRMPASGARSGQDLFSFPHLPEGTYKGLPGLLADSLPDRFGNAIIDQWLARQGRRPADFSPVERLCYTGRRGMGALEFKPVINEDLDESVPVQVRELTSLAQEVLDYRGGLKTNIGNDAGGALKNMGGDSKTAGGALLDIIRVGTSAGGNRPKAVIALNDETGEVRSGQVRAPEGFGYWILKFDGVTDRSLGDPAGYGRIEFAYHLMATAAGIDMTECRLLEEGGRAHFMTRRFDRLDVGSELQHETGDKLHLHSLCGLAHFDYNSPGSHSYEEAFQVMRELRLSYHDIEQLFRRMVFNVVARNQDDHTKNIAFLMDREGRWRLSPAFDLAYAYNPKGRYTSSHQMTIAGRRGSFVLEELVEVGQENSVNSPEEIVREIAGVVSTWPSLAKDAGVPEGQVESIGRSHRMYIV
ncbi:MAG: type II toxin-antitoxin system HipA family toxin [Bacteroidales bacterium]|nr:type II toxin-antitoxin system HipA family toxin [Candidatus Latescibacterota bacterium]